MAVKIRKMMRNLQRPREMSYIEIKNAWWMSRNHIAATRTALQSWDAQGASETRPNNANMPISTFNRDQSLKIHVQLSEAHPLKHESRPRPGPNSPDPARATVAPMQTPIELIIAPLPHEREAISNLRAKSTPKKILRVDKRTSWGILRTSTAISVPANQNINTIKTS